MAPVSEMREYQKDVAAYTGGTGRLFCTMAGYYPCHNTEEVLAASAYDPERDLANPTGSVFCAHGAGFVVPWYEVEDYMHLEGAGLDGETAGAEDEDAVMAAKAKAARSRSIAPSLADDKELEAIFVRTYGEIKRRKPQKERTFRGADTSYSEVSGRRTDGRRPHRKAICLWTVIISFLPGKICMNCRNIVWTLHATS